MSKVTLKYFNFSASRGEECRLALHVAGVEFHDHRINFDAWPALQPSTPFGALPVLEIEGVGTLAQSNAILAYIGRGHGLHPSDSYQAARHEAILCAVEDLRVKLAPAMRIKDPAEKQRIREELASGYMQEWAGHIEAQIQGAPFISGTQIQVADIKIYVAIDAFIKGAIDHIPSDVFAAFPRLTALHAAVKTHPKVAEWQSRTH